MGILTFEDLSNDLKFDCPPVFEVILPMTDEAKKLAYLQKTFAQVARLKQETFGDVRKGFDYLRVIPLIEGIPELTGSFQILMEYLDLHRKEYRRGLDYLRPFIARSDPPLNAGIVPAVIAAKIALSEYYRFGETAGIPVYPIIGAGGLPFRGGLAPDRIQDFLDEYHGVRTVTLQSAFRYDHPLDRVKKAILQLNRSLPKGKARIYSPVEIKAGAVISDIFTRYYQTTIEPLSGVINDFVELLPQRRERMLHIGLFQAIPGVSVESGFRGPSVLPARCIRSGAPPELIGTGRGLREIREKGLLPDLKLFYRNLEKDLRHAGNYLNKENLGFLSRKSPAWTQVQKDVEWIEKHFGIELGPEKVEHYLHRNLVSSIYLLYREGKDNSRQILEAAKLRRSLG